jgi:hypothetical protein
MWQASVGLDLPSMPAAYPLPYGEYLAETEALQLLTAHDLYNELRNLIASIQVRTEGQQVTERYLR